MDLVAVIRMDRGSPAARLRSPRSTRGTGRRPRRLGLAAAGCGYELKQLRDLLGQRSDLGLELSGRATAPCAPSRDRDHRLELGRRAVRPRLLDELEPDAQQNHAEHHGPCTGVAGRKRDHREHAQEDHERVEDRVPQQLQEPDSLILGENIRAVLLQAGLRLLGRQPLGPRARSA